MHSYLPNLESYILLPLVRDLHGLLAILERHARCVLLRRDGAHLCVILDERNAAATRHHADLAKAIEAVEDAREHVLVVVVGQVLDEQNAVGRQVLVGHNGRGGLACCLETGAARILGRTGGNLGRRAGKRPLETLLLLDRLQSLLLVCERYTC
jgi:hypothetical protein